MKNVVCAICNTNKNVKVLYKESVNIKELNEETFSARRIPDRIHYRFVKCVKCGLIFSNPIINPKKIKDFYKASDFNYDLESKYLKKTYFNYFEKFANPKNKNIKILDIGCGNGFFLEELVENGYKNVYGIEPGKKSVDKSTSLIKNRIKVNILKEGIYKKNTFDIICCFHTLDHIVEMDKFMNQVNNLLKKNGKAFFIVHDTKGLSVRLFGEKSPIFDIEHIYLFNLKTLLKIFEKYKFGNSKAFKVINNYPLIYWIKLFPIPLSLKNLIIKILTITKLGYVNLSLSAGNIGIVSKKK